MLSTVESMRAIIKIFLNPRSSIVTQAKVDKISGREWAILVKEILWSTRQEYPHYTIPVNNNNCLDVIRLCMRFSRKSILD